MKSQPLASRASFAAASAVVLGITLTPACPAFAGISDSELGAYDETYLGLRSFWSDDKVSSFFKHAADGTLDQVGPLVADLCSRWRNRDRRLPVTGRITVPPGIELDLNNLCT